MKRKKTCLTLTVLCLLCVAVTAFAETMYVTDRLYLSLRSSPNPEEGSLALVTSDTKVEVLETQGDWAKVVLEDGRTGWVMKKYLTGHMPKSLVIEQLQGRLESQNATLENLRKKPASLKREVEALNSQLSERDKRIEVITKESESLKVAAKKNARRRPIAIFFIGTGAFLMGGVIGYLVKRPKKRISWY